MRTVYQKNLLSRIIGMILGLSLVFASVSIIFKKHPPEKSIVKKELVGSSDSSIVCDSFQLKWRMNGSNLILNLATDLPDYTNIMVGVHRAYLEKGNPQEYILEIFEEESTIGKWRSEQSIVIDNDSWIRALKAKQKQLSLTVIKFEIGSISQKINASITVPVFQSNPKFGNRNSNLKGRAVIIKPYGNLVSSEVKIEYPLNWQ